MEPRLKEGPRPELPSSRHADESALACKHWSSACPGPQGTLQPEPPTQAGPLRAREEETLLSKQGGVWGAEQRQVRPPQLATALLPDTESTSLPVSSSIWAPELA